MTLHEPLDSSSLFHLPQTTPYPIDYAIIQGLRPHLTADVPSLPSAAAPRPSYDLSVLWKRLGQDPTYIITRLRVVFLNASCSLADYVGLINSILLVSLQLLIAVCLGSICITAIVDAGLVALNFDWTVILTGSGDVIILSCIWLVGALDTSKGAVLVFVGWSRHD